MTRTSSFTHEEDVLLCSIYMEILQDPAAEAKQPRERTWNQVHSVYSARKKQSWGYRSWRSLEARYQKIDDAVKKLKECQRLIEQRNPSDTSDLDIMDRAKQLMRTDSKWKSGFKFDHVLYMLKGSDKRPNGKTNAEDATPFVPSSESENSTSKSPIQQSPGLHDFFIALNENQSASGSVERSMGVKKAKFTKKKETYSQEAMIKMKQENAKLYELLAESNELRKRHLKIKEDKVMFRDVSRIEDPLVREYFRRRQQEIVKSMIAENVEQSQPPSSSDINNF